jgi:hypothetical protein
MDRLCMAAVLLLPTPSWGRGQVHHTEPRPGLKSLLAPHPGLSHWSSGVLVGAFRFGSPRVMWGHALSMTMSG